MTFLTTRTHMLKAKKPYRLQCGTQCPPQWPSAPAARAAASGLPTCGRPPPMKPPLSKERPSRPPDCRLLWRLAAGGWRLAAGGWRLADAVDCGPSSSLMQGHAGPPAIIQQQPIHNQRRCCLLCTINMIGGACPSGYSPAGACGAAPPGPPACWRHRGAQPGHATAGAAQRALAAGTNR
jgi:hypothetical protein